MLGTCLFAGAAGDGDASHDAMSCLIRTPFCAALVMPAHAAGISRFTEPSGILAVPRRWSRESRGSSFTAVVLMHYIAVRGSVRGMAHERGGVRSGRGLGALFWTVVVLGLHVAVNRHNVATLRPILASSAPTRTGELSDGCT
jgi:hypothetical protein